MRLLLYRYRLLTVQMLKQLTNYREKSIYNMTSLLKSYGELDDSSVPGENRKAFYLTEQGAEIAATMAGDNFRRVWWKKPVGQLNHYLKANQFFCRLVEASKSEPGEGLVEWLGPRDVADIYAERQLKIEEEGAIEEGRVYRQLISDGRGIYLFSDGSRLLMNLEYDTGTETDARLQEKILKYVQRMPEIFGKKVPLSHVLFVCQSSKRPVKLIQYVNAQLSALKMEGVVSFFTIQDKHLQEHVWSRQWIAPNGEKLGLRDMPRLPPREIPYEKEEFMGKKKRERLPQFRPTLKGGENLKC